MNAMPVESPINAIVPTVSLVVDDVVDILPLLVIGGNLNDIMVPFLSIDGPINAIRKDLQLINKIIRTFGPVKDLPRYLLALPLFN